MTEVRETFREYVNEETGEIVRLPIEVSTRSVRFEDEPEYIKLYLKTIGAFTDIRGTSSRLFYELVKRMEYANDEQRVYLNAMLRKDLQSAMGVRKSAFDKALRELRDRGIIRRLGPNTYAMNPLFVGKGKWKDIKRLRATFDFITGDVEADFGYADQ